MINSINRILYNSPIAMCIFNMDGKITYASKKFKDITGLTPGKWADKAFYNMVHPDYQSNIRHNFENPGEVVNQSYEIQMTDMKGNPIWLIVSSEFIFELDKQGHEKMVGIESFFEDITEQKLAEKSLHESMEKNLQQMANSPVSIYDIDFIEMKFINVNDAVCSFTGYSRDEMLSINPVELLTKKSRHKFLIALEKGFKGKVYPHPFEYEIITKSGQRVWALFNCRCRYKNARLTGALIAAHDITPLKKAQEALRDSKERCDLVIRGSNAGIWDWNIKTDNVFFSKKWKEIIGYKDDEISHDIMEWKKRIHPDDYQRVMDANNIFYKENVSSFIVEYRLKHKKGHYIWVLGKGACLRDENGNPVRMAGSHTDITERKKGTKKIQDINDELEKQVRKRTIDLEEMNATLRVLLKKREEDKNRIASNIFANYNTIVKPFIVELRKSLAKNEQKSLLTTIENNLLEIVEPFSKKLTDPIINLTPTEMQVAALVKDGKTNKEIAMILNKSIRAVSSHREHIREKLCIKNKKLNLRTFLQALNHNS